MNGRTAQQIPTRMTGPASKEVINKRRILVYQTDAGPLTAMQIHELTGLTTHRLWERYNKFGWQIEDIFSLKCFRRRCCQIVNLPPELAALDVSKLGAKQRIKNLQRLKVGTWEARNL